MNEANYYNEKYRPQFHYSPARNWLNDPNGLVYYEDEYHLFYQYHPYSNKWGPMHWGHAVSEDLVHWEHLPIALKPDDLGAIFSGSIVVDHNDTSGFFDGDSGLVAIYTNHLDNENMKTPLEQQSIAYSKDKGRTWIKYDENPVIANPGIQDFRDPKVIWLEQTKKWVMVLACADRIRFYSSLNLKEWDYLSDFGADQGSHGGVWECPDLFQLPVENMPGHKKWVLAVNIGAEKLKRGSAAQYFIGEFDGENFINDNKPHKILWADEGMDFYATQSFFNVFDNNVADNKEVKRKNNHIKPKRRKYKRKIWLAWMSNWAYADQVPTKNWRGVMTIPRELALKEVAGDIRLLQKPVEELKKLRSECKVWHNEIIRPDNNISIQLNSSTFEINADFEIESESDIDELAVNESNKIEIIELGLIIKNSSSNLKCETIIGYDFEQEQIFVDRGNSGVNLFGNEVLARHESNLKLNNRLKLQIFVDNSSIEVFVNEGLIVFTDLIFPEKNYDQIELYVKEGEIKLSCLELYELKSIW